MEKRMTLIEQYPHVAERLKITNPSFVRVMRRFEAAADMGHAIYGGKGNGIYAILHRGSRPTAPIEQRCAQWLLDNDGASEAPAQAARVPAAKDDNSMILVMVPHGRRASALRALSFLGCEVIED